MSLIVIKLGGSVITYKNSQTPKPRIKTIVRLAKEILQLHKAGYKIILVHGAGSFGHNLAKQYELTKGLKSEQSSVGLAKLLQSMSRLNLLVMNLLGNSNLPVVSFPPHDFVIQNSGELVNMETKIIEKTLDLGFIPVLYGDGVVDEKFGCSILSGDTITTYLAKKLKAQKVFFLSDVDGIFDRNPKTSKKAKIIPQINNDNVESVLENLTIHNHNDISGEMKGKILSIQNNLKGFEVIITNGLKQKNLSMAVDQSPVGTKLHLE